MVTWKKHKWKLHSQLTTPQIQPLISYNKNLITKKCKTIETLCCRILSFGPQKRKVFTLSDAI